MSQDEGGTPETGEKEKKEAVRTVMLSFRRDQLKEYVAVLVLGLFLGVLL